MRTHYLLILLICYRWCVGACESVRDFSSICRWWAQKPPIVVWCVCAYVCVCVCVCVVWVCVRMLVCTCCLVRMHVLCLFVWTCIISGLCVFVCACACAPSCLSLLAYAFSICVQNTHTTHMTSIHVLSSMSRYHQRVHVRHDSIANMILFSRRHLNLYSYMACHCTREWIPPHKKVATTVMYSKTFLLFKENTTQFLCLSDGRLFSTVDVVESRHTSRQVMPLKNNSKKRILGLISTINSISQ